MKIRLLALYSIAIAGAAFHFGHQMSPVKDHLVMVESQIPVCSPLLVPQPKQKYVTAQLDMLAAAVPARALRAK